MHQALSGRLKGQAQALRKLPQIFGKGPSDSEGFFLNQDFLLARGKSLTCCPSRSCLKNLQPLAIRVVASGKFTNPTDETHDTSFPGGHHSRRGSCRFAACCG
jgi:hypothetical protein